MRIVNGQEVSDLLDMSACIEVMADAMRAVSRGEIEAPARLIAPLQSGSALLALMPGSAPFLQRFGAKVVSFMPGNGARGLPSVHGFVALFDERTGMARALVDGGAITARRTAGASGLATRLLAAPDAVTCGLFGAGVQAAAHIEAMRAVCGVRAFRVWARDPAKAEAFARGYDDVEFEVAMVRDPRDAAACDIICTVTSSSTPVLEGAWVREGTHVNLVGAHSPNAREVDSALMAKAAIYVDSKESMRQEAGDILIPIREGRLSESQVRGEIGAVAAGTLGGRGSTAEITVYKSLGVVAQDLFAAAYVAERAIALGVGVELPGW